MSNDKRMLTGDDITDTELQAIRDQVQAEINQRGCPTDDELQRGIETMNASQ